MIHKMVPPNFRFQGVTPPEPRRTLPYQHFIYPLFPCPLAGFICFTGLDWYKWDFYRFFITLWVSGEWCVVGWVVYVSSGCVYLPYPHQWVFWVLLVVMRIPLLVRLGIVDVVVHFWILYWVFWGVDLCDI